jgi:hypothetical protein
MKFFTKLALSLSFLSLLGFEAYAQQTMTVQKAEGDIHGIEPKSEVLPVELPAVKAKELTPKFITNRLAKQKAAIQEIKTLDSLANDVILNSGEYSAIEVDLQNKTINAINPKLNLSAESVQALEEAPVWLRDQLKLKLMLLNKTMKDAAYAKLILQAPENLKDEVAFTVANMSYQSLTDSRFALDKEMIIRNAELIYKIADSLQYVKLVEHGAYGDKDYYTTTTYKIFDPEKNDTIWSEIPKEYYYWYIVHPKLDKEGVYVADNSNDSYGMRTYGYSWREFLWFNPDSTHNYMPINITTSKGSVKDIPRLGELMKQAKFLWRREQTYFPFGRPLSDLFPEHRNDPCFLQSQGPHCNP